LLGRDTPGTRLKVGSKIGFFLAYFWIATKIWPFPLWPKFWKVVCVTRAADVMKNPE
jgi:hypothetical protein